MTNCFFIAEAGVNHNGDINTALKLVEVAAQAGADAVKFQSFKADKLVRRGTAKASYQIETTGSGDQHDLLKSLELSDDMHQRIVEQCKACDIEFMSTAFDEDSADYLTQIGMKRFKVPSGEITNFPLIEHLAKKNLPLILSTGMCDMSEVEEAVSVIKRVRNACGYVEPLQTMLSVLHCTSNYPASISSVNLRALDTMKQKLAVPIGYSDHTDGLLISPIAVARGAVIIEKHFTLDRNMDGPDHRASISPPDLVQLIKNIRDVENALGDGVKKPHADELPVRELVRKSICYVQNLPKGHRITEDDLVMLRPGSGVQPKEIPSLIGKVLNTDVKCAEMFNWDDVS